MEEKTIVKETDLKNMFIGEAVEKYPQIAQIMTGYGLHCVGCHVNPVETISQGALGHGMPEETFEKMLKEVNEAVKNGSDSKETSNEKPIENFEAKVSATPNAAKKIVEFSKAEGKEGFGLRLSAVPGGCAGYQYTLEFDKPKENDLTFEQHGVILIVAKNQIETLAGVQVDFVDGLSGTGFKIENPNSTGSCGCGKSFH